MPLRQIATRFGVTHKTIQKVLSGESYGSPPPAPDDSVARRRWALLLDDIKPTTARCPWCWGERCEDPGAYDHWLETGDAAAAAALDPCRVCEGEGLCDPVPARGQQAVPWEWTQ
jgi:hypothetical protein